jgi:hypothetical protein
MDLGVPPGVTPNDSRFQSKRIPAFENASGLKEGDSVTLEGFLYLVATEANDCEYHIQIADNPRTAANPPLGSDLCVIVEVARPDTFSDPGLRQKAAAARAFVRTRLTQGNEPGAAGNVMSRATFVRVTGQLFFDDAHLKKDGTMDLRGKKGMKSNTLWELHPVFDIQFAIPPA